MLINDLLIVCFYGNYEAYVGAGPSSTGEDGYRGGGDGKSGSSSDTIPGPCQTNIIN